MDDVDGLDLRRREAEEGMLEMDCCEDEMID